MDNKDKEKLNELKRRMSELNKEQLATKDRWKKTVIRGDKQYVKSQIDQIEGKYKIKLGSDFNNKER